MKLYECKANLLNPNGTTKEVFREFIPAYTEVMARNMWNYRLSGKSHSDVSVSEIKVKGYNVKLESKPNKYKVLVEWTMTKEVEVEAFTEEEAIEKVDGMDLPDGGEYVGDSYIVHTETIQEVEED